MEIFQTTAKYTGTPLSCQSKHSPSKEMAEYVWTGRPIDSKIGHKSTVERCNIFFEQQGKRFTVII